MIKLNFSTAEELIFFDPAVQKLLPMHHFSLFEQWKLGKRMPMLREMGKQAILDFLNGLNAEDVDILEKHFGDRIIVEKLNYNITLNLKISLTDTNICDELCKVEGFHYFCTWRDEQFLYVSFWR